MKKIKNIFIFLVICSMVTALFLGIKTELSPQKVYYGTVHAEEGTLAQESGSQNVDYTCQIPDAPKDTQWVMMLQSHWTDYEIYVDDQRIYSTLGKRTGAFHLFDLPDGETLHIRYLNENASVVNAIENSKVWIGDKSSIPISAAIGYAWTTESHKDLEKLLHEADESMYENKKKLKACR